MSTKNLQGKRKKQPERHEVRRPCIAFLREMVAKGVTKKFLYFEWISYPDIGYVNDIKKLNSLKLDGYEKGVCDLYISLINKKGELFRWVIEYKSEKGNLTPEQKIIFEKIRGCNSPYLKAHIVRSKKDLIDIFVNEVLACG